MSFVLKDKYRDGRDMYFASWTAIGPACTPKLEEAQRFDSAHDAMQSPAFVHSLTFFEPFKVEEPSA